MSSGAFGGIRLICNGAEQFREVLLRRNERVVLCVGDELGARRAQRGCHIVVDAPNDEGVNANRFQQTCELAYRLIESREVVAARDDTALDVLDHVAGSLYEIRGNHQAIACNGNLQRQAPPFKTSLKSR